MNRAINVCIICAVLCSSLLKNVEAQSSNPPDSVTVIESLEALKEVVENLRTEIKVQASALNNLDAKVDDLKTLLINSKMKEEEQVVSLNKLDLQTNTQLASINKVEAGLKNQTTLLKNLVISEEVQATKLTNLEANMTTLGDKVRSLTEGIQKLREKKGIVEGIIAGTSSGVIVIPLDSNKQTKIFGNDTRGGVAFNWESRKVYWIEYQIGIKTANLDGSSEKLLIAGKFGLHGLAVDQITGNFYYGAYRSIRACDTNGKKCKTVVSGKNNTGISIFGDIALFPSEGLMFWSNPHNKSVTRANMDGTHATVVISDDIYGLYSDEFAERLYMANYRSKSIDAYDLSTKTRNILVNVTNHPYDVAVDGDTSFFGSYGPIYSVTQDGNLTSIANINGLVFHIALYGRHKVSSRPNPCKNSPCANLWCGVDCSTCNYGDMLKHFNGSDHPRSKRVLKSKSIARFCSLNS